MVALETEELPTEVTQTLAGMGELTAGDFEAVIGRLQILGKSPTVEAVLDGLREEVFARGVQSQGIGFLRAV